MRTEYWLDLPLRIEFPVRKMLFTQSVHNIPQTGNKS
nr:MAG TPA: hypothetical protein [Inoviridae sp.]